MRENEIGAGQSASAGGFRESLTPALSPSGITRVLLAFVSLYIVFASLAVCLAEVRELRIFNLYYLAIMGLCSFLAVTSLRGLSYHRARFGRERWIPICVLLGFGLAAWINYRYPHLFTFSLWMDEITQFQGDWNLPRRMVDPAFFAAIQQQPPADYYLSAFARITLGTSEFAVLIHSIVFGILSFLLFLVWLKQIRFPLALAPIPILLFASHHTLLRFSSEARPISLAVFFTLAVMIFLFESVERKKVCARELGASSLLLLYSVGLQPMFFLVALTFGLLPLIIRHLGRAEAAKLAAVLCLGPLLLFSPTLWEIYRESERQSQFFATSYFERWWNALTALNWKSFWTFRATIEYAEWLFFIPFLVLAVTLLFRAARSRKIPAETAGWAFTTIIFSLLFPVAFMVFWSIVNWNLNFYYFALWPLGLLVLASVCVASLLRPAMKGKAKIWSSAILAVIGAAAVLMLQQTYVPAHKTRIEYDHSFRPNWHEVVKRASQSKNPALVIEIPYGRFGWPPYHSVSGVFYEDPPFTRVVRLEVWNRNNFGIPPFRIRESLKDLDQKSDIYFLMTLVDDPGNKIGEARKQKILSVLRENSDELIQLRERNFLLRVSNQASPVESTKSLFRKIIEADPTSDRNFYLADALAAESLHNGACAEAKKWFGIMKMSDQAPDQHLTAPGDSLRKYLAKVSGRIAEIPACDAASLALSGAKSAASPPH